MVSKVNVVFGGWYQRTTLHLSEVQRFLLGEENNIDLPVARVRKFRNGLKLKNVKRKVGYLEFLEIETTIGIKIRYFEDGLYVLSKEGTNVGSIKKEIQTYFNERFEPAINYLFSLGAPTPKILANLKETHPIVIERVGREFLNNKVGAEFGKIYLETDSKDIRVSKSKDFIVVDVVPSLKKELGMLTEMQIFFSDFKLQLHRYLDIHRKIWEDISSIKEKEFIRGEDVEKNKAMLDSYQKTIQLITNRINQMSNYAKTRQDISDKVKINKNLNELFQYRFEDLFNTLEYIKEVWSMTLDYVNAAIRILEGIEKKVGEKGLKSIQFLVGFGVIAGVFRYMGNGFPSIILDGVLYVVGLVLIAVGLDKILQWNNKRKRYKMKFVERAQKL